MVKNTFKFTKTWKNIITKKNKIKLFRRKKDSNENFNYVSFPKQVHSFYIEKYLVL